jgi:hypothetical protein
MRREFQLAIYNYLALDVMHVGNGPNWGSAEVNRLKYGNPPTYQVDAVVSQGDSTLHPSHFVAINLRGTVTILEFPGNDPSQMRVLESTSIFGPNAGQIVVKLSFIDLNQNRKPELLIEMDGVQSELVNDGNTFRPPTPTEQQQLQQYLQLHSQ